MSSSEFDNDEQTLITLEAALQELQPVYELSQSRLQRLVNTAFENPAKALRAADRLRRTKGPDFVIEAMNNRGLLHASHYFGHLKGQLFYFGKTHEVREALNEIPEVLREVHDLSKKRGDLIEAREAVLQRLDRSRISKKQNERQKGHTPDRTRDRTPER